MKLAPEILTEAIENYRIEGAELMKCLAERFGYNILIPEQYDELISRGNPKVPRKGQLSSTVNYAFHGGECHFHKKKTQQNIEVILSNPPIFGEIDAWFLKEYLDSTDKYKAFSKELDWLDLKSILQELYRTGTVQKVV